MKLRNETILLLIGLNPELEEKSGLARMQRVTYEYEQGEHNHSYSRTWEFVTNQPATDFESGSGFVCTLYLFGKVQDRGCVRPKKNPQKRYFGLPIEY